MTREAIAAQLGIGVASVYRVLRPAKSVLRRPRMLTPLAGSQSENPTPVATAANARLSARPSHGNAAD